MIEMIRQGLKGEGFNVSIFKLRQWFSIARWTVYYKSIKAAPNQSAVCRTGQSHDRRVSLLWVIGRWRTGSGLTRTGKAALP